MKIVLDTTVFENGFNLRSADVQLLKSFLSGTKAELCVPGIVREEAINRVRKRAEDVNSKMNSLHRLTGDEDVSRKVDIQSVLTSYKESLDALLGTLRAQVLPYPVVSHEQLAKRALVPSKPFVDSGRGYRDALIWYSLLELAQNENNEVIFLSENSDDWCENRKEMTFHRILLDELDALGVLRGRVSILPNLAEFNRRYAVSSLPVVSEKTLPDELPVNYVQLLIDGREMIESHLLVALPDSIRRMGVNLVGVGEFGILGVSSPTNVQHEPERTLDGERRLLQFSADYRVAVDLILQRAEAAWWIKRFSFQLRQDWHYDQIRAYITLPVRASFHMIEKGENTKQFSLASAEIALPDIEGH